MAITEEEFFDDEGIRIERSTMEIPVYTGLTGSRLAQWITEHSTLRGTARAIASLIASRYYTAEGVAYPSHDTLATDAGVSPASVKRAVKALKESGEWGVVTGTGGRKSTNALIVEGAPTRTSNAFYPILTGYIPEGVQVDHTETITVTRRHQPAPPAPLTGVDDQAYNAEHGQVNAPAWAGIEEDVPDAPVTEWHAPLAQPIRKGIPRPLTHRVDTWARTRLGDAAGDALMTAPADQRARIIAASDAVVASGQRVNAVLDRACRTSGEIHAVVPWMEAVLNRAAGIEG